MIRSPAITLRNLTLATLDAAGCDTSADIPLILIDAPARKLTLAQATEFHARLGALLAEQFAATLASFRTRARNHGRTAHTHPITDPPPREMDGEQLLACDGRRTRKLKSRGSELGRRLTRERAARNWTQAELARRATALCGGARIMPNYISQIETGIRAANPSQVRAMERALGLLKGELSRLAQGTHAPEGTDIPDASWS